MRYYFVGLAMRSRVHDYARVHAALWAMKAKRVSPRIWLCAVDGQEEGRLDRLGQSLATEDEMLVVELPVHAAGKHLNPFDTDETPDERGPWVAPKLVYSAR